MNPAPNAEPLAGPGTGVIIERILCPVDFSEASVKAYRYAQSVAGRYRATLVVQHVVELQKHPSGFYSASWQLFEEFRRKLIADGQHDLQQLANSSGGIRAECIVQEGLAADAILSLAQERAVSLIVMGTHGSRGIDHLTMGSVTEKVLRKAHCPVLAVRKPAHESTAQTAVPHLVEVHRIVCCTDFSEPSGQAWEHAVSLAAEYRAELALLHVLDDISGLSDIEKDTREALERVQKQTSPWAHKNVMIKPVVRIGKAYQQIIQLALESQADLIVMGVRGRHALDLAVFGSTTYRVVQLGPCPVLVVHFD